VLTSVSKKCTVSTETTVVCYTLRNMWPFKFLETIQTHYTDVLTDTAERNIKQYLLLWIIWPYVLCN